MMHLLARYSGARSFPLTLPGGPCYACEQQQSQFRIVMRDGRNAWEQQHVCTACHTHWYTYKVQRMEEHRRRNDTLLNTPSLIISGSSLPHPSYQPNHTDDNDDTTS